MAKKIHPHLKHFIRGVILSQVNSSIGTGEGKKDFKLIEDIVFLFYEELFRLGIEEASSDKEKELVVSQTKTKLLQTVQAVLNASGESFKTIPPELWRTKT